MLKRFRLASGRTGYGCEFKEDLKQKLTKGFLWKR